LAGGLRRVIAEREQELADRPEKIVDKYIDVGELNEARAEAERAFRSRENAWQALVEIRLLHREVDDSKCRCGQRMDRCEVAVIVDRYPGVASWEAEQIARLKRGERHALPDGHPEILDRRGYGR
jgi:hypothetical protein